MITTVKVRSMFLVALLVLSLNALAQANKPVALLKGQVTNPSGDVISGVQVSVYKGSELTNNGKTNSEGKYQIVLKGGTDYRLTYTHPEYYFKEDRVNIPELDKYKEIPTSVVLKPVELGKPVQFSALIFEPSSSNIEGAVVNELEMIASAAKKNKLRLTITVYPDQVPSGKLGAAQKTLAEGRKGALTQFFLSKNVSASSFSINVNNNVPTKGVFERTITVTESSKSKKKKKSTKTTTVKKVLVPQYAEIVMNS